MSVEDGEKKKRKRGIGEKTKIGLSCSRARLPEYGAKWYLQCDARWEAKTSDLRGWDGR